MANAPAISVIIPIYNAEKYFAACLESILVQTLQDFEVIVVDDCSTDNSVKIAESYLEKFSRRLRLSRMKKNSGSGALPRNKGLALSRGKYVFFVDADDLITPTALEELYTSAEHFSADVAFLEKHFEASADLSEIYTVGKTSGKPTLETENLVERVHALIGEKFFLTPWSKIVRRDFLVENEILFPHVTIADDDIWTYELIFSAQRILRLPNPVYTWRQSENSTMRKERTAQETINFWLNPIIFGLKTLNNFMSKIEFFQRNVQYRCAVLEFFVHSKIAQVFYSSLNLSLPEIYTAVNNKFCESLGEHDVLISWLLTDLIIQQKNFAQIKNT